MSPARLVALLFVVVSIGYGALAFGLEADVGGHPGEMTPRTYPLLLSLAGTVLALLLLVSETSAAPPEAASLDWRRLAALAGLMALYAVGIRFAGLLLATTIFLAVGFLLLGERRLRLVVAVAAGTALAAQLLATQVLGIYVDDPLLRALGIG